MTGQDQAAPHSARRGRYHHGDLREALIQTAIEVLGERGAGAFSMAEASRRLGVAVSAPYRHFADRDALLAAVALRAASLLTEQFDRMAASGDPATRLAAAAQAYVRFADRHRPLFQALAGSGLSKNSHPEVARAAQAIGAAFRPRRPNWPAAANQQPRGSPQRSRQPRTGTPCSCSTARSAPAPTRPRPPPSRPPPQPWH